MSRNEGWFILWPNNRLDRDATFPQRIDLKAASFPVELSIRSPPQKMPLWHLVVQQLPLPLRTKQGQQAETRRLQSYTGDENQGARVLWRELRRHRALSP